MLHGNSGRWFLAIEGGHASEYDPLLQPRLRAEAVRVIRGFSFAGAHVVIVGGLVPSLLVPKPELGIERHIGTQDLDLCLSVALVDGNVGNYDRLEKCLKDAKFEMARDEDGHSTSWRWLGGVDLPLTVEFFCAAGPGREEGRLFRPGGVVGGKLSALVLSAGRLIDEDTRDIEIEVDLPGGGGTTRHTVKVAGPAAYLAAKADALRRRTKNKDAYDVVWLAESWPGGQVELAKEILAAKIFNDTQFLAALRVLAEEFASIDSAGAVKYARFMGENAASRDRLARQAVGAMRMLLDALPR
jgi:hypothetical protein